MDYSKFYTPRTISEVLVNDINLDNPKRIIDICCGSCNLLNVAEKRWQQAEITGVDINNEINNCIVMDGRQYALTSKVLFDIVLANPPFEKMKKKREFPQLYKSCFKEYFTLRLENEMLLANLKLLNPNGLLMIILPSTFVEGEINIELRKIIAKEYTVKKIVKLPSDTFGSKRICTYAIYIINSIRETYTTTWVDLTDNTSKMLSHNQISSGLWNINLNGDKNPFPLVIKRGKISSNMFTNRGTPVLHTSKKSEDKAWYPNIKKAPRKIVEELATAYAEDGDILINRIGKSAGYWIKYRGDTIPISDCLIAIKDDDDSIYNTIREYNRIPLSKGVVTQYIAAKDFNNWYSALKQT